MKGRFFIALSFVLLAFASPGLWAASLDYQVIVHPANPATKMERRAVADLFLKKSKSWPNGQHASPVDLSASSPVRARFSDEVLKRSLSAIKSYWQQQIFSGRGLPPPELDSDEAVIRFVLNNPGAVGYVSAKAQVGTAKVLSVE